MAVKFDHVSVDYFLILNLVVKDLMPILTYFIQGVEVIVEVVGKCYRPKGDYVELFSDISCISLDRCTKIKQHLKIKRGNIYSFLFLSYN